MQFSDIIGILNSLLFSYFQNNFEGISFQAEYQPNTLGILSVMTLASKQLILKYICLNYMTCLAIFCK